MWVTLRDEVRVRLATVDFEGALSFNGQKLALDQPKD